MCINCEFQGDRGQPCPLTEAYYDYCSDCEDEGGAAMSFDDWKTCEAEKAAARQQEDGWY